MGLGREGQKIAQELLAAFDSQSSASVLEMAPHGGRLMAKLKYDI